MGGGRGEGGKVEEEREEGMRERRSGRVGGWGLGAKKNNKKIGTERMSKSCLWWSP